MKICEMIMDSICFRIEGYKKVNMLNMTILALTGGFFFGNSVEFFTDRWGRYWFRRRDYPLPDGDTSDDLYV